LVTGVQTCALPICELGECRRAFGGPHRLTGVAHCVRWASAPGAARNNATRGSGGPGHQAQILAWRARAIELPDAQLLQAIDTRPVCRVHRFTIVAPCRGGERLVCPFAPGFAW